MSNLTLRACDIFLSQGGSLLAQGIRWATREPGEGPTEVNHVGAIYKGGMLHGRAPGMVLHRLETAHPQAISIEALGNGVVRRRFDVYAQEGQPVAIFRPRNLTDAQRSEIRYYLATMEGQTYGYGKLLVHLARRLVPGSRAIIDPLAGAMVDKWPICSFLVAHAFREAGLDFGVSEDLATPDDIWDFCTSHPDKYELVWGRELGNGLFKPVPLPA